ASAKKPTNWLSGDQNGSAAPSVLASGVSWNESSVRIQICCFPSFTRTTAIERPSGETASERARDFSGSKILMRAGGGGGRWPKRISAKTANRIAAAPSAAASH